MRLSLSLSLSGQTGVKPPAGSKIAIINPAGSHDGRQMYERLYVICPMIGAGTSSDPRRPQVSPVETEKLQGNKVPSGIIAWTFQISDDGKSALVELVARDASAFKDIARLNAATAQTFSNSTHSKDQIESAFKAQRKDFDFKRFRAVVR